LLSIEGDNPVSIRITGHQWWWELRYEDQQPSRIFSTANEIHIPVGRPVELNLESLDVIHSFWVPSLAGKMDLIPGRHNKMTIDATNPGVYRGQCAEFCGYQHAHMKMLVIAEPSQQFESWKAAQILPAASVEGRAATGQQIFLSSGCVLCHTIRGTRAGGNAAPDLTHFGSRRSVAANTLPLTHSDLVAWIADPQHVKPGANMPKVKLSDDERDAVAIYLEALK
jgi:cytochrome c oxidase subunit 2